MKPLSWKFKNKKIFHSIFSLHLTTFTFSMQRFTFYYLDWSVKILNIELKFNNWYLLLYYYIFPSSTSSYSHEYYWLNCDELWVVIGDEINDQIWIQFLHIFKLRCLLLLSTWSSIVYSKTLEAIHDFLFCKLNDIPKEFMMDSRDT